MKYSYEGQQRTCNQETSSVTRKGGHCERHQAKHSWPVKKKSLSSGSYNNGKCNTSVTNDGKPRFKYDWPIFFSSIIAKHPKRRKTQEKISKNKSTRNVLKKGMQFPVERVDKNEIMKPQQVSSMMPVRPLPSPVKFSDSHSIGIFGLRKTATPILCSLSGKGAFTSYSRGNQIQNQSAPVDGQETPTMTSDHGFCLANQNSVLEAPLATSADTLREAALLPLDQQHNRARHNTRFLNTSATEPHSSSNDCSLMAEQHIPLTNRSPTVYAKSFYNHSNLKADVHLPLQREGSFRLSRRNNVTGAGTQHVKLSRHAGTKDFVPPLQMRSKARTISLTQESKSKTYDKSFSINLQLQTPMPNSSRAQSEPNKSKVDLHKASPLQFEMPMQEPLFSDIIQTLNSKSKTVRPLCARKSGMGAYLDEASKRSSRLKSLTENSIKKISTNSSKYFLGPAITKQPSEKLKGNTVFRITRNRVTTLKTQQGQRAPHASELGLLTRKQLFQQRSKTAEKEAKTSEESKNKNTETFTPTEIFDSAAAERISVIPKCSIFTAKISDTQNVSEQAQTFRVRRVDGTDPRGFRWQFPADTNNHLTNHRSTLKLGNHRSQCIGSKPLFTTCKPRKLFFAKRSTHDSLTCPGFQKTNLQDGRKDCMSPIMLPLLSQVNNDMESNSKTKVTYTVQNHLAKPNDPLKQEKTLLSNKKTPDSHLKSDKAVPLGENTILHSQHSSFCSCSNSHCSYNLNHLSGSSSFHSSYAADLTCKPKCIKKSHRGQVKKPIKVLSVSGAMSRLHEQCAPHMKYHPPTNLNPYRIRKLRPSCSKACSTASSSTSVRKLKNCFDDRIQGKNKKNGKRITVKDTSFDSKFFWKNTMKSPLLSREENIKDNYVKYCKMKKTKLLRHEPYRKGRSLQRKDLFTIPKLHRAYRARNRNNCSPLYKRRMTLNSPSLLENFNCATIKSSYYSNASSLPDRQLQGINDNSFFSKQEKKLDVDSEMCSQNVCYRGDQYTFSLSKPSWPTTNISKNFTNFKNGCSELSMSKRDSKVKRPLRSINHSFVPHKGKIESAETTHRNDTITDTIKDTFKPHDKSPLGQVVNTTEMHIDDTGESPSYSFPTTKSHMTQTDTSRTLSLDVAIQTSPTILYTTQGPPSRRPRCKSNHRIQDYVKHRVREMRFEKFLRRRQLFKYHLPHIGISTSTDQRGVSQWYNTNRNRSVCRARVAEEKPSSQMMSEFLRDGDRAHDVKDAQKCFQKQTVLLKEKENQTIAWKKTHQPQKEETFPKITLECAKNTVPNTLSANSETKSISSFTVLLSEIEITPQLESLQCLSEAKQEVKSISKPSVDAQEMFTPQMQSKSSDRIEPGLKPVETGMNSEGCMSPRTSELHNMCLVRPSWKNVNIEEVDRRVKWALRLRRELQLSRSSRGQRGNAPSTSDMKQNIGREPLMYENKSNQIKGDCHRSRKPKVYNTNGCTNNTIDTHISNVKSEPFYSSISMHCDSAAKQTKNCCKSHYITKNDGGGNKDKDILSCDYSKELKPTYNRITKGDNLKQMAVRGSTPPELSSRTERSLSLHDLTANAEKVLDIERPASVDFQAQIGHASCRKKAKSASRHGNSPPNKISRIGNNCCSSSRPRLVGSLVQRLPQVPLSSFVEWFIETSDPKNFLTPDKSSASSDEKGSECKSISCNNTISVTMHHATITDSSNQGSTFFKIHSDEAENKFSAKSSMQTHSTMSNNSNVKKHNKNEQSFSKAMSHLSTKSFQNRLNSVECFNKDSKLTQSCVRKNVDANESNQLITNVYQEIKDLKEHKRCVSKEITSGSQNATPSLAFETNAPNKNKTLYVTEANYIDETQVENPQIVDTGAQSTSRANSQTYTCDDSTTAVEKSLETDRICIYDTLCSSSGQGDDDDTDYSRYYADDRFERQTCDSNIPSLPHTWDVSQPLPSSAAADLYLVSQPKLTHDDLDNRLRIEPRASQASRSKHCSAIIDNSARDKKSAYLHLEGVSNDGQCCKEDGVETKCDPGIRHILMKLRQPDLEGCSNVPEQKSGKVRITLRRSSDVSGIVAKFQNKNNNA